MATIEKFKQINAFINRAQRAPNAGHLSWMKKFKERMQTLIVTTLGQDCPAMVSDVYTRLAAAVVTEDDCFRIITRSALTEQIAEADTTRDNTFIGLKTMVEALSRVGTAAQKDAAPRVLQAIRDYQVSTTENYELESTHIEQLIQVLEINPLSADCATLGITALVAQLKSENQQVQALISQRSEEQNKHDPRGKDYFFGTAQAVYSAPSHMVKLQYRVERTRSRSDHPQWQRQLRPQWPPSAWRVYLQFR